MAFKKMPMSVIPIPKYVEPSNKMHIFELNKEYAQCMLDHFHLTTALAFTGMPTYVLTIYITINIYMF